MFIYESVNVFKQGSLGFNKQNCYLDKAVIIFTIFIIFVWKLTKKYTRLLERVLGYC